MPKRFTPTEQWDKEWFMRLTPEQKCLWKYINDKCDQAGVWSVNRALAEAQIGARFDWDTVPALFDGRLEVISGSKWWLPDFVRFQYGELSRECRAHKPVFDTLQRHGLLDRVLIPYQYPTNNLKEKELEEELEKDKEKELGGGMQGGDKPDPKQAPEVESVLNLWAELFGADPTRTDARIWVARRLGLARQSKGHEVTPYTLEDLERAIRNYRLYLTAQGHDKAYAVRNFFNSQHAYCDAFTAVDWQPPRPSGGGIKGAAPRIERNLPDDQLNF